MVALREYAVVPVPLAKAVATLRTIPKRSPLLLSAKAMGTSFGV
jgi:hypothetical protein